ncbi:MAG: ABC transporter permease [Propionibacteriaceae bacterium]|nr:ABC transporter permease [Propionibacteriaceae bacterium]
MSTLISEFRKIISTKFWWVLTLIVAGYVAMTDSILAFAASMAETMGDMGTGQEVMMPQGEEFALFVYSSGASLCYVFPAILGALIVNSEFRYQTITPTFLAQPRRGRVLIAKLIVALPFAALTGVVLVATSIAAGGGVLALTDQITGLEEPKVWEFFLRVVAAMTIWGLVGVGLGALIKNQIAAIVGLLGFTQFLEPILRLIPLFTGEDYQFLQYLPGAVNDAISGVSMYSVMMPSPSETLSLPIALAVLAGYALAFTIGGYFTTFRRDIS